MEIQIFRELHCDGLVEIGVVDCRSHQRVGRDVIGVSCEWPIIVFANLIVWADRVRNEASMPPWNMQSMWSCIFEVRTFLLEGMGLLNRQDEVSFLRHVS